MLGIEQIGSYKPTTKIQNEEVGKKWGLSDEFLRAKIGVKERLLKDENEDTSDMAVKAFEALRIKVDDALNDIEALVVVTQNPDYNIPHVAGLVHGKLGLPSGVSTFDISLGCSGYVYGINIILGFMQTVGISRAVLITADPYSKIIDREDKNTVLLFGDAATATLIGPAPIYTSSAFAGGSEGDLRRALICEGGILEMNGRDIFNFAVKSVPRVFKQTLSHAGLSVEDIDAFLFHQGSGFILETLTRRLSLEPAKVVRQLFKVGNTVSSSIPLLLENEIEQYRRDTLLLCGFGVGLSYASCILKKMGEPT